MKHKFNAAKKHKLDNPERRKMLPPESTLLTLGLRPGDYMADIGCGVGYFSLPAAGIVGMSGKVYAVDIEEEMLADVRQKAEQLTNIEAVQSTETLVPLPDNSVSFVFAAFVLHEAEDLYSLLQECRRLLIPAGKAVFLEWEKKETIFGPPVAHRLSKEEVVHIVEAAGLVNVKQISLNEAMYAIIATIQ